MRAVSYQATRLRVFLGGPNRRPADRFEVSSEKRQVAFEPSRRSRDSPAREVAIYLAGDVALQDPDDLPLGAALLQAPFDVGLGLGVTGESDDHDAPQGVVGLAVATAIE